MPSEAPALPPENGTPGGPPALRGRRFAAIAGAVLLATNVSYLYHWLRTPPGARFLGNDFGNLIDIYTYVAWMKQAAQGHLLFQMLYDPAPQERVLFLPLYLALGRGAAALGLDLVLALHLGRVVLSLAFLAAARWLCRSFAPPGQEARAFFLLALGSGLPGFMTEATPFSSMFTSGHATAGWVLLLPAAGSWLRWCGSARLGWSAAAGACLAALLLVHPFETVPLGLMALATSVAVAARWGGRRAAAGLAVLAGCAAPAAAIVAWSFSRNPCLARWAAEPRPFHGWELLSFGTVALLALGLVATRAWRAEDVPMMLWALCHLALALAPLPSSRRYLQGLAAPLAILAVRGYQALAAVGLRRIANHLVALAFPASGMMLVLDLFPIIPGTYYVPRALVAEIASLEELPPGLVMAPPGLDYLIPPFSGRQVYAGHIVETPAYEKRAQLSTAFAAGESGSRELAAASVRYVLLPLAAPAGDGPGLVEVWRRRHTKLLEVRASP